MDSSGSVRKSFKAPSGREKSEVLLPTGEFSDLAGLGPGAGSFNISTLPSLPEGLDDHRDGPPPLARAELIQLLASAAIGNTLEWYDFMMYSYMGSTISALFFPPDNQALALLSYYGIFAVAFMSRPFGAAVFGYVGDRYGRKVALLYSMMFMAIPTALVGALPTFDQAGWTGPILLVILRAVQGFAVGGEYTTTMTFMAEHSPLQRRYLMGAVSPLTCGVGVMISSLIAISFTWTLSTEALQQWGWRVPFFFSLIGAGFGLWVRKKLKEPEAYVLEIEAQAARRIEEKERARQQGKQSWGVRWELFKTNIRQNWPEYLDWLQRVTIVFMIDWFVAVAFYTVFTYMPTYFSTEINVGSKMGLLLTTMNNIAFCIVCLLSGWLYDWWLSPQMAMSVCTAIIVAVSWPMWNWMKSNPSSDAIAWFTQFVLAVCTGIYQSATPTLFVFNFPPRWRCSGVAIAHNLCMATFGGTAPLINQSLIQGSGNIAMPGAWVIISAGASLLCVALTAPFKAGNPCPRVCRIKYNTA